MRKRSLLLIALNVLFINGCNLIPSMEGSQDINGSINEPTNEPSVEPTVEPTVAPTKQPIEELTRRLSYQEFLNDLESYDVELYNDFKLSIDDSSLCYNVESKFTVLESGQSQVGSASIDINDLNASLSLKGLKEADKSSLINGELLASAILSMNNFYETSFSNEYLNLSMYLKDSKFYGSFNDGIKKLLDPNNEGNTWPQKFYFDMDENVDGHINDYISAMGLSFPLVGDDNFSFITNKLYDTIVNNLAFAVSPNFYGILKIESSSMEGTIEMGGYVVVDYDSNDYQVGDIISYNKDGNTYTHRIISINEDGSYITKGDANDMANIVPVYEYEILGKVVEIYPANTDYIDIANKYGLEKYTTLIKKGVNIILEDLLEIEKTGDNHVVSLNLEKETLTNKFNELVDKLYTENIFNIFEEMEINNEFIDSLKSNFSDIMSNFSDDSSLSFSMNLENGLLKSINLDANILFNMKYEDQSYINESIIKANLDLNISFDYLNDLVIDYPDFSSHQVLGE